MRCFFCISLLIAPILTQQYYYGVDISVPTTPDQVNCLKASRYDLLFVRAFKSDGINGTVDMDGVQTIKNAMKFSPFVGINVYMEPEGDAVATGANQLDSLYTTLIHNGINIRAVWVQVTENNHWNFDHVANIRYLNSLIVRAQQYGLTVGIYTSAADWQAITGNATNDIINSQSLLLWYYKMDWAGVTGESAPNFDDFVKFGPFNRTNLLVKQFAAQEVVCDLMVNRDVQLKQ